jgi:competence protein ComEA
VSTSMPAKALAAVAALAVAGFGIVLLVVPLAEADGESPAVAPEAARESGLAPFVIEPPVATAPSPPGSLVVDVQGAVLSPGVYELPAGSRVADAVGAAGGYGPLVDLPAAARAINLAAPLADGAQVYVPGLGDRPAAASAAEPPDAAADGGASAGGLVALNSASADELEALPGIGPVTADKIIAARQERPFTTLEELVERKVMNNGQLAQIRDLVTVP